MDNEILLAISELTDRILILSKKIDALILGGL